MRTTVFSQTFNGRHGYALRGVVRDGRLEIMAGSGTIDTVHFREGEQVHIEVGTSLGAPDQAVTLTLSRE